MSVGSDFNVGYRQTGCHRAPRHLQRDGNMAEEKRFDPARLEPIERRLQVLEGRRGDPQLESALCRVVRQPIRRRRDRDVVHRRRALGKPRPGPVRGAGSHRELLPGSLGDLFIRDPLQPKWPYRGGRRYGPSPLVLVHDLARWPPIIRRCGAPASTTRLTRG